LHTFELGDKRPSQLLREMQELSDNKFSDDVLKILWIQRLPAQCQTVQSCFDSELEELASKADKIMQVTTNTVINEAIADPPEIFQNLQNQVEELIQKVEALNNRPTKNWYNKPTQRRRQDSTPDVRPCWYHMKFGSRAHRCQLPCKNRERSSGKLVSHSYAATGESGSQISRLFTTDVTTKTQFLIDTGALFYSPVVIDMFTYFVS
jgi:hypothetical protein